MTAGQIKCSSPTPRPSQRRVHHSVYNFLTPLGSVFSFFYASATVSEIVSESITRISLGLLYFE